MKKSVILLTLPLLLAGCGIARIVTVAPAPEPTTVVVAQPRQQTQVVYTRPVSTTVTYSRTHTTRTTIVDVNPMTSDVSLYLDLQAVAAAFGQAGSVEEFETILNSRSYIITNLDLNRDGYIDYLRVLEVLDGRTHVLLIQAVLAANVYQDVASIVVEMGYTTPYVQVIGAPYIYGANYIIEPVYYRRPQLFDRFGRPTYSYWRSPYYWDNFPHHYGRHEPYHLSHYQAYVSTYMENHHYCHTVNYADSYHYGHYEHTAGPVSRSDYARQYPEQSFSRRTTATYIPAGGGQPTRVTNARHLQQAVEQSGASRTTTTQSTRTTTNQPTRTTTNQSTRTTTNEPVRTTTNESARTTTATQTSRTGTTAQPTRTTTATQQSRTNTQQPETRTTTTRVRTSGTASTTRSSEASTTRSSGTTGSTRTSGTSTNTRSRNGSSTRR